MLLKFASVRTYRYTANSCGPYSATDVRRRADPPLIEHITAPAGVPPGVPPVGLLYAARALCIYRCRETNALAWITLDVCLRSPALVAAVGATLLIVYAWSLMRHIQYVKPLYKLPVFSCLLAHSGITFTAINTALLVVELAMGAGCDTWFDVSGWLAPAWP